MAPYRVPIGSEWGIGALLYIVLDFLYTLCMRILGSTNILSHGRGCRAEYLSFHECGIQCTELSIYMGMMVSNPDSYTSKFYIVPKKAVKVILLCYLFCHLKWPNIHPIGGWTHYSKDDKCNSFTHIHSKLWIPILTLPPPHVNLWIVSKLYHIMWQNILKVVLWRTCYMYANLNWTWCHKTIMNSSCGRAFNMCVFVGACVCVCIFNP